MNTNATRICIIDSDETFTRRLRQRLEETGHYQIREINHPSDTLEAARGFRPDVILLDLAMPDLEELEIEKHLGRDKYLGEAPIVFLASMAGRHEPRGYAFRNDDGRVYIDKPVCLDSLRNCIHFDLPLWNQDRNERDHSDFEIAV